MSSFPPCFPPDNQSVNDYSHKSSLGNESLIVRANVVWNVKVVCLLVESKKLEMNQSLDCLKQLKYGTLVKQYKKNKEINIIGKQ